jgi:uncharacterized membrane protein HdeD (DUF308 family)
MQYPVDYMNALMIMITAFITLAGIIIAFVATSKAQQESKWGKLVIGTSTFSIIAGILGMVYVLDWFNVPSDSVRDNAIWSILIQFVLVYIPLISVGLSFRKAKK